MERMQATNEIGEAQFQLAVVSMKRNERNQSLKKVTALNNSLFPVSRLVLARRRSRLSALD